MREKLFFIGEDCDEFKKLNKISEREKLFNEHWLQELLIKNPHLLPTRELDESWDKLIPLGREVSVKAGSIDNLYITPNGLICLVETKLWRNFEAHRTVVAQIIAYAKDLAGMTFDEFKECVEKSNYFGGKPGFWQRISKKIKGVNRVEFQHGVQESLDHGRFLLLIVGDKIYPEVAMILETIQSAPNLEYKIGLIELHMYRETGKPKWPVLVLPQIVMKTKEKIRSVVRIIHEEKKPEVRVTAFEEGETKLDFKTFKESVPSDYANDLIPVVQKWIEDGFNFYWGKAGFSIRFFWRGRFKSILDIYPDYISLMTEDMVKRKKLSEKPFQDYKKRIMSLTYIKRLFAQGRRYLYYERDIPPEEFPDLVDATDKLVRDYIDLEGSE